MPWLSVGTPTVTRPLASKMRCAAPTRCDQAASSSEFDHSAVVLKMAQKTMKPIIAACRGHAKRHRLHRGCFKASSRPMCTNAHPGGEYMGRPTQIVSDFLYPGEAKTPRNTMKTLNYTLPRGVQSCMCSVSPRKYVGCSARMVSPGDARFRQTRSMPWDTPACHAGRHRCPHLQAGIGKHPVAGPSVPALCFALACNCCISHECGNCTHSHAHHTHMKKRGEDICSQICAPAVATKLSACTGVPYLLDKNPARAALKPWYPPRGPYLAWAGSHTRQAGGCMQESKTVGR